jgi:hypothetical protein
MWIDSPSIFAIWNNLNMIVELERGRNYSFAEISKILTDVGFKNIERRSLAGPAEILIGYKK